MNTPNACRLTLRRFSLILTIAVGIGAVGLTSRPAHAAPILQEVFYDAAGSDSGTVFTEILGHAGMSLDGWSLVGLNGGTGLTYRTLDLTGATIPADGLLVVATSSAEPSLAAVRDFVGNVDWQNGPDAVHLVDPLAGIVDALQYGDAGVNNAGFGVPAVDAPAGSSLSRDMFGTNTFDNFADFMVGTPSPGIGPRSVTPPPPPSPVSEPATLALLGSGLMVLARRHRRATGRARPTRKSVPGQAASHERG